jgi:hypothetical protein
MFFERIRGEPTVIRISFADSRPLAPLPLIKLFTMMVSMEKGWYNNIIFAISLK